MVHPFDQPGFSSAAVWIIYWIQIRILIYRQSSFQRFMCTLGGFWLTPRQYITRRHNLLKNVILLILECLSTRTFQAFIYGFGVLCDWEGRWAHLYKGKSGFSSTWPPLNHYNQQYLSCSYHLPLGSQSLILRSIDNPAYLNHAWWKINVADSKGQFWVDWRMAVLDVIKALRRSTE